MKERGVIVSIAGLAIVVAVQIGGFVWWAATISSDVRHLTLGFVSLQSIAYTKTDAEKDLRNVSDRQGELVRRVQALEASK